MKSINQSIIESIILIIAIAIFSNLHEPSDYSMRVMGVFGMLQLTLSIYTWSKVTGLTLTPYVVFLIAAYTFTFGQSMLYVFDKVSPERDLAEMFPASAIYPAQIWTLIFLGCFHIGALYSCRKKKKHIGFDAGNQDNMYVQNQIIGIRKIGTFFLIISTLPYIIERVSIFTVASTLGYGGIYEQEVKIGIFNIFNILSQYFIPGILCKLIVEDNKKRRNLYIALMVVEIIFWLYVGGRSTGVIIAAILMLYYHIFVRRIRWKEAVVFAIAGYFFISLLGVIAETRSSVGSNVAASASENFAQGAAFYSALSEMGGSMYPMITSMDLVPAQYDYKCGSSYFFSLTSIIPNLGFWDLHPAMKYGNLNEWLQKSMNLNYGPGFSIVAEAYVNFGYLGFLFMLLLGYCFGSIFNVEIKNQKNPLLVVLAFVFCFLIIKTVRNSFLATVRSVFYYIVPIYLIVSSYYKGKIIK